MSRRATRRRRGYTSSRRAATAQRPAVATVMLDEANHRWLELARCSVLAPRRSHRGTRHKLQQLGTIRAPMGFEAWPHTRNEYAAGGEVLWLRARDVALKATNATSSLSRVSLKGSTRACPSPSVFVGRPQRIRRIQGSAYLRPVSYSRRLPGRIIGPRQSRGWRARSRRSETLV